MVRRKFLLCFIALFISLSLFGQTAEEVTEELITQLSLEYRDTHPDLAIKPNVAVLTVTNGSGASQKYDVGPAFTAIIYSMIQRSIMFNLIDVNLRDSMIEEMRFALTGLAESETLDPGKIKLIDYFLQGSVAQLGNDFLLTLNLVDVETGDVVHTVSGEISGQEVFETSEEYSQAYVSPYGLGIEFGMLPWAHLYGKTAEIEGPPAPGEYGMLSFMLHYRVRKWLVTWGGMELSPGAVRFDDSYNDGTGVIYDAADMQNISDPSLGTISYKKHREPYYSLHLGAGWVWNISKLFNLTFGADLSMTQTFLVQEYDMPSRVDPSITSTHVIKSNDISMWTLAPVVKMQTFITPRVAINFLYKFKYQLPWGDGFASTYSFQDGTYSNENTIPQLYDLDPSVDPMGNKHYTDLTGHTFLIGMGFYF